MFLTSPYIDQAITLKCMVRRRTARGLKMGEGTVCVNVSGLLVENRFSGHLMMIRTCRSF
jgi:hypothetical protein